MRRFKFLASLLLCVALWTPWEMHQSTEPAYQGGPPFWYKPWKSAPQPISLKACLDIARKESGRRKVTANAWYNVHPDPPPDYGKWIGCWTEGFRPDDPPK